MMDLVKMDCIIIRKLDFNINPRNQTGLLTPEHIYLTGQNCIAFCTLSMSRVSTLYFIGNNDHRMSRLVLKLFLLII